MSWRREEEKALAPLRAPRHMAKDKKRELPSIEIEGTSENEYEFKDGRIVRKQKKDPPA